MSSTPLPSTPETFFDTWLPQRLEQLDPSSSAFADVHCSLHVTVDDGRWWLSIEGGRVEVERTLRNPVEADFQICTERESFAQIVSQGAQLASKAQDAKKRLRRVEPGTLELVKNIPGSLQLRLHDRAGDYWLSVGPGAHPIAPPACTLSCALADYLEMRAGRAAPMDLFMAGKIRIDGDAQIAMALAGIVL